MLSHEALKLAVGRDTVEHAKSHHKSTSLIHKWTEPATDYTDSGAFSPLDRLETIIETSLRIGNVDRAHSLAPIQYLAQRFNCLLLPLPESSPCLADLAQNLNYLIKEFGDLVATTAEAMADHRISPDERRRMEKEGQELQVALGVFLQTVASVDKQ
jgi:hypothetical protein